MDRNSRYYDSPPSAHPLSVMEDRDREDREAELRSEIATLKEKNAKLKKIARDALAALSDYDGWLTREEERHGDEPVRPPHFELVKR